MTEAYKLENFTLTDHFLQRAKERFGINTTEKLQQFIQENNIVTNSGLAQTIAANKAVLSKQGNMFIIDTKAHVIVTVYKSITPVIAEKKRLEFQNKLNSIIQEAQFTVAKDYLAEIKDNFYRLYFNAMEIIHLSENFVQNGDLEEGFDKIEQIYKDVSVIKTTLNLLSKQTTFFEQHKIDYVSSVEVAEEDKWASAKIMSLNKFQDSDYKILTFDANNISKTEPFSPNYKKLFLESAKEVNLPEDYKPKVSNEKILSDKIILKDYFNGKDRTTINNWFSKQGKSKLGSQVIKSIKAGQNQVQLENLVKSQLSIIQFNKFKNLLEDALKKYKK